MTINRMTGPDSAVMCNLINTHAHTNTHNTVKYFSCDTNIEYCSSTTVP